ncbi:MAG: carbamoyl-phosphate synthase domain-containing protein, partial [Raoultibacter sp.]
MSKISDQLLEHTSKPAFKPALLVLEDGSVFSGRSCAAAGEVFGEICFNTSMEGYLEVITDPSYAGQIITLTYPQIGNYGVNLDDAQSDTPALRGLVVHDMCATPSNWRSQLSLPDFLRQHQVVAIEGVDTRALTRHIRDCGAQRAVLSTLDTSAESLLVKVRASASIVGLNLVPSVSCAQAHPFVAAGAAAPATPGVAPAPAHSQSFALAPAAAPRYKVIAYDCGVKRSILENLVRVGCSVEVVPW